MNEVYGLELRPYRFAVTRRGPLPAYIPFIGDRGKLVGPLRIESAAISLYSIINHQTGTAKYSTRQELLEHFRLHPRTKLIITSSAEDSRVEHFWQVLRNKRTAQSLARLQPQLVTTPNFSMHANTVRHDNLVSMARIAYCFEAFAAVGLPVAPHINGRTPHDFDRWIKFLNASPGVHTISYELGTAGRSSVRRRWHADQLVRVAKSVKRPLALLIRAGSSHVPDLGGAFDHVTLVDSNPLMKAKFRRAAAPRRDSLLWDVASTDPDESIDHLFQSNVRVCRRYYTARLQLVTEAPPPVSEYR